MPFKKLNMKNYGYKKCEKNFKQWVTCMKKQENTKAYSWKGNPKKGF